MANEKHARRPWIFIIVFAAIIVYIIVVLITTFTRNKSALIYEVANGSVTESMVVSGIILRDEKVFNATESGNIEYYQSSGAKVKVDDIICSVDKTGEFSERLKHDAGNGGPFSDEEKFQIHSLLSAYRTKYEAVGFEGIYETKAGMNSIFLSSLKELIKTDIDGAAENSDDSFSIYNTDTAGYVIYSSDGFEDITVDNISEDMFDPERFLSVGSGVKRRIQAGEPAYKIITGDNWNIYCRINPEIVKTYDLENVKACTVKLNKAGAASRANFELKHLNGEPYALISLNKYVMSYAGDRFMDFEIYFGESAGLQVPNSAIVESPYYKIPRNFLTKGNNSNASGFIVEENGGAVFKEVDVDFNSTDYVFVKPDQIIGGSTLIMTDSDERFEVSETQPVKGVYLVNSGYAVFKAIDVIKDNKEYSVLNESTSGVKHHDRILLNASGYKEGDVVY